MLITISLYDCVIYGTLECKHVYFWKMYGDELYDYQMYGGATRIGPSTGKDTPLEE